MKILVVEDTYPSLYLLQCVLTANGYEVATAENGLVALDKLRHEPIDLIISDVLMPEMSGRDLLLEIKKRYPECVRFILSG